MPSAPASGGIISDLSSAANQLGVGQAIDLLKGVVMPSITQAIQGASSAAAAAARCGRLAISLRRNGTAGWDWPVGRCTRRGPAVPLQANPQLSLSSLWPVSKHATVDPYVTSACAVPPSSADDPAHRDRGDRRGYCRGLSTACPASTNLTPQRRRHPARAATLTGLGGGETIREVSQATPFSMVALTGSDLTGTSARVRAKRPDGSWGPWYEADTLESNADDGQAGGPRGTDPVFVGTTTVVQIAVTRPAGAPVTVATPEQGVAAGGELGYLPATAEHSFSQNLSAVLITPPKAPVDTQWARRPRCWRRASRPTSSRARSGGRRVDAVRRPGVRQAIHAAVVHHTAGSNDYAPEGFRVDRAVDLRLPHPHLGWCDIAYNALVDKYGQVFEGGRAESPRMSGISHRRVQPRRGGVSMIGDFEDVPPTDIQVKTVRPPAGLADEPRPRQPGRHRATHLGRRAVHRGPRRQIDHAADDLRPPRCRQHRVPG